MLELQLTRLCILKPKQLTGIGGLEATKFVVSVHMEIYKAECERRKVDSENIGGASQRAAMERLVTDSVLSFMQPFITYSAEPTGLFTNRPTIMDRAPTIVNELARVWKIEEADAAEVYRHVILLP